MKEYFEIEKTIMKLLFGNAYVIDDSVEDRLDNCEIAGLSEKQLKEAYEEYRRYSTLGLSIYSEEYYEIGVRSNWMPLEPKNIEVIDPEHVLTYTLGDPSLAYCVMILDSILNSSNSDELMRELQREFHFFGRLGSRQPDKLEFVTLLSKVLHIRTLRISTDKKTSVHVFEKYAHSFEYMFMYKRRRSLSEISDINALLDRNGGGRARVSSMDEPPRRIVNEDLLDYYAMAQGTEDPFTRYISFYHIIEYHFDAVYKSKLIEEIRNKLTSPSFSYRKDKSVYELAEIVKKRMKINDEHGSGNEFDSLKYVLSEYVPIEDLKQGIAEFNSTLINYYGTEPVQFIKNSTKSKVAWNDPNGCYTTLSNRIYEIRNALVHSKSEQKEYLFNPQKHRMDLEKEIPLIQVIAELIIFYTGSVMNM